MFHIFIILLQPDILYTVCPVNFRLKKWHKHYLISAMHSVLQNFTSMYLSQAVSECRRWSGGKRQQSGPATLTDKGIPFLCYHWGPVYPRMYVCISGMWCGRGTNRRTPNSSSQTIFLLHYCACHIFYGRSFTPLTIAEYSLLSPLEFFSFIVDDPLQSSC
jgi:hypothetical protein